MKLEQKNDENKALQVIEQAVKLPFVKVKRKEFLLKAFSDYNIDMNELIENGPVKLVSKTTISFFPSFNKAFEIYKDCVGPIFQ